MYKEMKILKKLIESPGDLHFNRPPTVNIAQKVDRARVFILLFFKRFSLRHSLILEKKKVNKIITMSVSIVAFTKS